MRSLVVIVPVARGPVGPGAICTTLAASPGRPPGSGRSPAGGAGDAGAGPVPAAPVPPLATGFPAGPLISVRVCCGAVLCPVVPVPR
ncbi:hypothetical protein GCM10009802_66710 [Streptomyces synnematoformans]|uniref:Secreted protein n=1 Tax=Streptomyces synnematoformans TaxID=415721 RepID=A0ABP4L0Y6_9ACTN